MHKHVQVASRAIRREKKIRLLLWESSSSAIKVFEGVFFRRREEKVKVTINKNAITSELTTDMGASIFYDEICTVLRVKC